MLKKGVFLVASPDLKDPNFSRTVILLCERGEDGAMGLIVNRPTAIQLSGILPPEWSPTGLAGTAYQGGPVQPDHLLILHGVERDDLGSHPVCQGVFLGGDPEALKALIAAGSAGAEPLRCYLGYAGWSKGQLEEEVRRGDWKIVPALAPEIFTGEPAALWEKVSARKGAGRKSPLEPPSGPDLN